MKNTPKILIIAGSDSGSGAGIQADLKSASANGVHASTAIASITAQNTRGVQGISDVPLIIIEAQVRAVLSDIGASVIKTGMLSNKKIIDLTASLIEEFGIPAVIDPVMVAKGGSKLLQDDAVEALKNKLLPHAYLVTPNIPEAEVLCGFRVKNEKDMEKAGKYILDKFECNAALIKGGHLKGNNLVDVLVEKDKKGKFKLTKIRAKRIKTKNTHGTGCTYASAIAANLAKKRSLSDSVKLAHKYLQGAIKNAQKLGAGHSPVNHFWNLKSKK